MVLPCQKLRAFVIQGMKHKNDDCNPRKVELATSVKWVSYCRWRRKLELEGWLVHGTTGEKNNRSKFFHDFPLPARGHLASRKSRAKIGVVAWFFCQITWFIAESCNFFLSFPPLHQVCCRMYSLPRRRSFSIGDHDIFAFLPFAVPCVRTPPLRP